MKFGTPLLLKKSSPSSPEEVQDVSSLKTETEESIDVIIEINEKKSIDEVVDVPNEGITIKVNDKAVTLENSASTEEGKKFIDDLQQVVEEEDAPKQEEQQQQQASSSSDKTTVVWGKKLMFWQHVAEKATKVEKEEEPVSEESKEQEQPVEQKEETEPIAEAEAEAEAEALKKEEVQDEKQAPQEQEEPYCGFLQGKLTYWQAEAAKAQKGEQQPASDESKQEEETTEKKGIITRWLHRTHVAEVAKEQKEEQPVSEESKQEVIEAKPAETETETEKEVDDEASGHKIEFFVDGVAIQTIKLTKAGMERLKNFIASVQEGATEAVSKSWLVEKMNEFFESAKNQDDALENAETHTPSVPAPVEEETAEIVTSKAKRSWWPFGKTETKVVDEVRNETAEGTDAAATEEVRQGAEVA